MSIFISDKLDFMSRTKKDKQGHYIIIKVPVQQKDVTIVNIYTTNAGTHKYIKQELVGLKEEFACNTIIVVDFNTPTFSNERIIQTTKKYQR